MACRQFPNLKWAQRRELVYITIDVLDVEKTDISLSEDGKLTFRANAANKQKIGFDMELFKAVDKEASRWNLKGRNVILKLAKKDDDLEEYWPRLTKNKDKNARITVDWSRWVDEDEADQAPADDGMEGMQGFGGGAGGMGGMDMQQMMAQMQGMGGMGGAGGAGGMDMNAMMQQMQGMNMGGMGGPDSDDEDEEEEAEGQPKAKNLDDLDQEAD